MSQENLRDAFPIASNKTWLLQRLEHAKLVGAALSFGFLAMPNDLPFIPLLLPDDLNGNVKSSVIFL